MPLKPIHHFNKDESQRIFAWARYVYWSEVERKQYEGHEPADDEPTLGLTTVLMVQWYATLWVAVEGWRECPLSDETVDELLTDPAFEDNVQLLRRFRNGVYHYQPELINERLLAFFRQGEHAVTWAFLLHEEFMRVIWEITHPPGVTPTTQLELADAIRGIVGWLPTDIPEAAPHQAAHQHRESAEMILKAGGRDTPLAKDLLEATRQVVVAANQAAANWNQEKRAMIEALKQKRRGVSTDAT